MCMMSISSMTCGVFSMELFENTVLTKLKQIKLHNYLISVLISGTIRARVAVSRDVVGRRSHKYGGTVSPAQRALHSFSASLPPSTLLF